MWSRGLERWTRAYEISRFIHKYNCILSFKKSKQKHPRLFFVVVEDAKKQTKSGICLNPFLSGH